MWPLVRRYLLDPPAPRVGGAFVDDSFVVVEIGKHNRTFEIEASAMTELPKELIKAGFDANVSSAEELAEVLSQTAEAAGLANRKKWALALPEGSARSVVVALENEGSSRKETDEMVAWKVERSLGISLGGFRVSKQRIRGTNGTGARYLVTLSPETVLSQYEAAFALAGWHVGLLVPRHLAEAQWLMAEPDAGDKMLITAGSTLLTSVIVRNGEPILIRTHESDPGSFPDEIYRLVLFYRDRFCSVSPSPGIDKLLVIGNIDPAIALQSVGEASESAPNLADAKDLGLDLGGEQIAFQAIAAAAGPTLPAWQ